MKISRPNHTQSESRVHIRTTISGGAGPKHLDFYTDARHVDGLHQDRLDAQLIGLLPAAMNAGDDIFADGLVSEKLLYNLNAHLIPLLSQFNPRFSRIQVTAAATSDDRDTPSNGVATGFSGGIDSFCTISDHLDPLRIAPRLTHLLFNNAGALPKEHADSRQVRLQQISDRTGLELIRIDSNINEFIKLPYEMTHTLRNTACALLLQGTVRTFLYSSAYTYSDVSLSRSNSIASIDPLSAHLMSTEGLEVISTGSQYTRIEKTAIVANYAPARDMLHVCISPDTSENCSRCWKCGRTLLTLELLGNLEDFAQAFDLSVWARYRSAYIGEYLLNWNKRRDPFVKELSYFAKQKNLRYQPRDKAIGLLATVLPEPLFRPTLRLLA